MPIRRSLFAPLASAALMGLIVTACREQPTGPPLDSGPDAPVRPSFAFTGGFGKVLGTTWRGELVEIDLDAGAVTLIGDAGVFGGFDLGWTDIAVGDSANLFALSRRLSDPDGASLYRTDPTTGAVIADVGPAGQVNLADFDFDGADFLGIGRRSSEFGVARLFTIDTVDAQVTWITPDTTVGVGLNPFDTVGQSDPIRTGGFAVHPSTGELWGVEGQNSDTHVLFRIDPLSGEADTIMPLGLDGAALPGTEWGFDGLHILDDGTFIGSRGGNFTTPDSSLWEISSSLDPSSGRAEIALIPLTFDTLIVATSLMGWSARPRHLIPWFSR